MNEERQSRRPSTVALLALFCLVFLLGLAAGVWLDRTVSNPTISSPHSVRASGQWVIGRWLAENGARVEFKADGSFEQTYQERSLAPGQVIADAEDVKTMKFVTRDVRTVGRYRWVDDEVIEIERFGVPNYRLKVVHDGEMLGIIAEGGQQDRFRRVQ